MTKRQFAVLLCAIAVAPLLAFLVPKQETAAVPDTNAVCGPAITQTLDAIVKRHMLTVVNVVWSTHGPDMVVDGIYAAGSESYHITMRCTVLNGAPRVTSTEV